MRDGNAMRPKYLSGSCANLPWKPSSGAADRTGGPSMRRPSETEDVPIRQFDLHSTQSTAWASCLMTDNTKRWWRDISIAAADKVGGLYFAGWMRKNQAPAAACDERSPCEASDG